MLWIYGSSLARLASILEVPLRRIRQRVQGHFPSEFNMLQQKHMLDMCCMPCACVSTKYCFAKIWKLSRSSLHYIAVQEGSSGCEAWAPEVLEFIFNPGFPMFSNVFLAYPFHLNEAVWKRVSRLIGLQLLLSWAGAIHAIGFAGYIHRISQMRKMSETSQ